MIRLLASSLIPSFPHYLTIHSFPHLPLVVHFVSSLERMDMTPPFAARAAGFRRRGQQGLVKEGQAEDSWGVSYLPRYCILPYLTHLAQVPHLPK